MKDSLKFTVSLIRNSAVTLKNKSLSKKKDLNFNYYLIPLIPVKTIPTTARI